MVTTRDLPESLAEVDLQVFPFIEGPLRRAIPLLDRVPTDHVATAVDRAARLHLDPRGYRQTIARLHKDGDGEGRPMEVGGDGVALGGVIRIAPRHGIDRLRVDQGPEVAEVPLDAEVEVNGHLGVVVPVLRPEGHIANQAPARARRLVVGALVLLVTVRTLAMLPFAILTVPPAIGATLHALPRLRVVQHGRQEQPAARQREAARGRAEELAARRSHGSEGQSVVSFLVHRLFSSARVMRPM